MSVKKKPDIDQPSEQMAPGLPGEAGASSQPRAQVEPNETVAPTSSDPDGPISAEELRQAEELASLLEQTASPVGDQDEALQAAQLLRWSLTEADISDERLKAIGAEVEAAYKPARPSFFTGIWRYLFLGAGATALAAVAAVLLIMPLGVPDRKTATALPSVQVALIEQQARAARISGDLPGLRRKMGSYRRHMYVALTSKYGATP